jgi:4-oxalocrotonate tautomerase
MAKPSSGLNRSATNSTTLIELRTEERTMPHVIVKLWPGKSEQQKRRLAEAITRDITTVLHYGDESVSVALEEIPAAEWSEKVYRPDIVEKAATLYKKPGYEM